MLHRRAPLPAAPPPRSLSNGWCARPVGAIGLVVLRFITEEDDNSFSFPRLHFFFINNDTGRVRYSLTKSRWLRGGWVRVGLGMVGVGHVDVSMSKDTRHRAKDRKKREEEEIKRRSGGTTFLYWRLILCRQRLATETIAKIQKVAVCVWWG